jgi:DNA polymerase I-like protein with 3'-5' exonuclease and polymerase domains
LPVIETHKLGPHDRLDEGHAVYNGLDCCLTLEIHEVLARLSNQEPAIYDFERAMQAPALDMMLRGFRIDEYERRKGCAELKSRIAKLDTWLQQMCIAACGRTVNPRSGDQLKQLFYSDMNIPEIWSSVKGERKLQMTRETLEKLETYLYARPIIATILEIREQGKKLEVLETEVDPDGRMRTGYNIAGTESGRWSSSASSLGTGRNIQNIDPSLRLMFIADEGWKICGIDLEQAESREVGLRHGMLFDDWKYLNACEAGDLHTGTSKLIWTQLPWTGDGKLDRAIADGTFYREFSYRDMAKRGGHGTSYMGAPFTIARHLKVPQDLVANFQRAFFKAYPAFERSFAWTSTEIQTKGFLITPFGRTRHFFGRTNDDATLREAVAFVPQSSTADRLNLALWRIWRYIPEVQLLAQVHDAIYFQYRDLGDDYERDIIHRALQYISTPLTVKGRVFDVPGEAKVGWNWGNRSEKKDKETGTVTVKNPDGLQKWKGSDSRTRTPLLKRIL